MGLHSVGSASLQGKKEAVVKQAGRVILKKAHPWQSVWPIGAAV